MVTQRLSFVKMSVEDYSKTLKGLYFGILTRIADSMTSDDKLKFELWSCNDLSRSVLETNQPLKWFGELQRKGKITPENLGYLEDFLKHADLGALYEEMKCYQARREQTLKSMRRMEARIDEHGGFQKEGFQMEKIRNPGMAFALYGQEINVLLESSSLCRTEKKSLSRKIKILARQLFGRYVCSPEKSPVGSPISTSRSDSQCRFDGNPRENVDSFVSSMESLSQKIAKQTKVFVFFSLAALFVSVCHVLVLVFVLWKSDTQNDDNGRCVVHF